MTDTVIKIVAGAMAGAVVSWGSVSLTLVGRVDAIEKGQNRIERRLDQLFPPAIAERTAPPPVVVVPQQVTKE